MSEKLPKTSYIFVDRRKTGGGKSLGNRQRLLRRIQDAIRQAKPKDIDAGGIKSMSSGGSSKTNANPVKVTRQSLHEPSFHYARSTGNHDIVLIGNDEWERGDDFPLGGEGEGEGGVGGEGDESEDDFVINVSRDEFFNVFFEDCALPDLVETHAKELPEFQPKHAGFQREGNPAQLNVVRSYKNALPRKRALTKESRDELEKLEAERDELMLNEDLINKIKHEAWVARLEEIQVQMQYLQSKIAGVPFFEKLDLRYTKKEKVLVKSAEAVFAMIMDISGSMDEEKKRMARKFFSLQYAFIRRKYPQTDLIFIAHTDKPHEMTEEEFFSTRLSGGTIVSPAYTMLNQIISSRYNAHDTNIYLSQASDGDNWDFDNAQIIPELETSGLLSKLRYMSYAQVGQSFAAGYGGTATLWSVVQSIASTSKKISMVKITDDSEVFDAFHKVYKKKTVTKK